MGRKATPKAMPKAASASAEVALPDGALPSGPPPLHRATSATSPLSRHDCLVTLGEAPQVIAVDEEKWGADCKIVLQEAAKQGAKLKVAAMRDVYAAFAGALGGDEDGVFGEGLVRFFEALGVCPATDLVALEFARQCQAKEMGIFRRREFIRGLVALGVDSLDHLRNKVPELRRRLEVPAQRRELYVYSFALALEPPARTLDVGEACSLWQLFLAESPHLEPWCAWVTKAQMRCSKDLWDMFWLFATEVPADLSTYDDCPDWPLTLDQFVEHLREQRGA